MFCALHNKNFEWKCNCIEIEHGCQFCEQCPNLDKEQAQMLPNDWEDDQMEESYD